jgi:hypothetical protein
LTHSDHDIRASPRAYSPARTPAAVNFAKRTMRRAITVLWHLHGEQVRAGEILCQASRALPEPRTGPLTWVRTMDGCRLAGSHLPDPDGRTGAA